MSTHKNPAAKPAAKASAPASAPRKQAPVRLPFVFGKMNYILTAVSLAVLVIGFVLMSGSQGDIYDARRITLAPIVVILGFILGFVAIFYKEKGNSGNSQEEQA